METDLKIRLQAYATTAEVQIPSDTSPFADALASSKASSSAAATNIICSHARILRGDSPPSWVLPGQHELDLLAADKRSRKDGDPAAPDASGAGDAGAEPADEASARKQRLPLHPGKDSLSTLALGASGIPAIKNAMKSPNA